jgi:cob(I)alamin adenosyltransferase
LISIGHPHPNGGFAMADRLTIITTRTGDDGTTGLADGSRIKKTHCRVNALGEVDELNSQLGLLLAELNVEADRDAIGAIIATLQPAQHALFDIGSELAIPGHSQLLESQLVHLDEAISQHNARLEPLREFILPGGSIASAQAHVCRSVCRRAERAVLVVVEEDAVDTFGDLAPKYLNRLSDLLFVLARYINQALGQTDTFWKKN